MGRHVTDRHYEEQPACQDLASLPTTFASPQKQGLWRTRPPRQGHSLEDEPGAYVLRYVSGVFHNGAQRMVSSLLEKV